MKILYIGTSDLLDWSRRQILTGAGYDVVEAHDSRTTAEVLDPAPCVAVVSDTLGPKVREAIFELLRRQSPQTLILPFTRFNAGNELDTFIPPLATPDEFLRITGTCLMRQHHHPEHPCEQFVYVDRRRKYIHVSDSVCVLLGRSRDEILGRTIDSFTYPSSADAQKLFAQYIEERKQVGEYVLLHRSGAPIPVHYEASVLDDGCMLSCFTAPARLL